MKSSLLTMAVMDLKILSGITNTKDSPFCDEYIEDFLLVDAILAPRRNDNCVSDAIKILEYGQGNLARNSKFRGVLVTEESASALPENSHLLAIHTAGMLPNFEMIASLLVQAMSGDEESDNTNRGSDKFDSVCVLSIGKGAFAALVMDWFDWTHYQPILIRVDREVASPELRMRIQDRGFGILASSAVSDIYGRSEDSVKYSINLPRVNIRTFDVFDTLIARRCVWPHEVFEAVGTAVGVPDFHTLRKRAEAEVYGDAYTLGDIYARLADIAGLSADEASALQNLEMQVEIQNVIPIAENLAQIGPSDVLVSDMYLSAEQIRSLLKVAGFTKANQILVRPRGKHTGETWADLNRHFSIACHLGDNEHSDYDMALRHGVPARLTATAKFSPIEDALADKGFPLLARAMREARLSTYCDEPDIRRFQDIQTQINFPLLMIAGLHLSHVIAKSGYEVALMASRDCNLWVALVEQLAEMGRFNARPVYLHTNRNLLRQPTPSYTRYVRSLAGDKPVFVDLVGTGLSAQIFSHKTGLPLPTYFVHDIVESDYAAAEAARLGVPRAPVAHRLSRKIGQNSDFIEAINGDTCGALRDLVEVGAMFMPRREPADLPIAVLRRVQAMHEAFEACVRAVTINGIDIAENSDLLENVGGIILDILQGQNLNILIDHHRQSEYARSGIDSYKPNKGI